MNLFLHINKKKSSIKKAIFRSSMLLLLLALTLSFTNIYCKKGLEKTKLEDTISTGTIKDTTQKPDTMDKPVTPVKKEPLFLFAGTYSGNNSKGIYVFKMDSLTGSLEFLSAIQTSNPSYLCVHPNKKWVFAVNETDNGAVNSYAFDTVTKNLTFINTVSSQGKAPCYISIDKTGKFVMVANYTSGNITLYPINENGSLEKASSVIQHSGKSIDKSRQTGPHAHMISQIQHNNFAYVSDLGIDKILRYTIDTVSKKLIASGNTLITAGSGPRHFAEHPKLYVFYVLNELKGTIEVFNIDNKDGNLTRFQSISNMKTDDNRYPGSADIHITPNGKFLYATNRGEVNTIGMYSINQSTGELTFIGFQSVKGKTPRNFVISPSGKYLLVANQDSGNIFVFEINESNGILIDKNIEIKVPNVVCLKFY